MKRRRESGRGEGFPSQTQLANCGSNRAEFQVLTTPIRDDCRAVIGWIEPLAMRAAAGAGNLAAAKRAKLHRDVAVSHATSTSDSVQITSPDCGTRVLSGNGRFCSAYNSSTAASASETLANASSNVSPSV